MEHINWNGFKAGAWQNEINVRDFIQQNYTPYEGDSAFLADATERTTELMKKLEALFALERQFGGVLDIDTHTVSSLTAYTPGYIDKDNELIVGMQTNRPLKRGVNPFGGIRMARASCEAYGYKLGQNVEEGFRYRTTTAYSAPIPTKCAWHVSCTSLRACPTVTAVAVSSATTAVWHCTAWTV